ncbi:hypothetical protein ACFQ9J_13685 [Streptomyces sp. NPDC056529]|uniref:hypothetical protein n=1 Tax=Streptomyces sp. NPDC056529 TaxID=3345855 RepID=UPI0036BFCBC8
MTRRVKGNPAVSEAPDGSIGSYHREEHDENAYCSSPVACVPVPAEPGVLVPATSTVLVIDGIVQDIVSERHTDGVAISPPFATEEVRGAIYTITVRPPKPAFFEPEKTYTRFLAWSIAAQRGDCTERFECTVVEKEGDGKPVAFGHLTVPGRGGAVGTDTWCLKGQHDWRNGGWKEVDIDGG